MKEPADYVRDITAMRAMMERSSKFMSIPAAACILAGVYALAGAFVAYRFFDYPLLMQTSRDVAAPLPAAPVGMLLLAAAMLVPAIGTVLVLSARKARAAGHNPWTNTSRQLLLHMSVPLVAGGLLALIFWWQGLLYFLAPLTLIFYGIAMFNASKFSFGELKSLGLVQTGLGLLGAMYVQYGLLLWTAGFGLVHIAYGIYLHYKYER